MPNIHATITDITKGPFRLSTLMRASAGDAIDGITIVGFNPKAYVMCQYAELQFDPSSATGTLLWIGGSDTDSTHYGFVLQRGQVKTWFPASGNSIRLPDFWVNGDANGLVFSLQWNVM